MSQFLREKDEQLIRDVRDGAEEPNQNSERNDAGHDDGESGQEVGLPSRPEAFLHWSNVGWRPQRLKIVRRAEVASVENFD